MRSIPNQIILESVEILGTDGISEEEIETKIGVLVSDEITFRRLRDCIPEAFGIVLASHLPYKIELPTSFFAMNQSEEWQSIPLGDEPVFVEAINIAQHIFHNGPRSCFQNISEMSGITHAINSTLNAGGSLEGSALRGPQMLGIPAELYCAPAA